MLRHALIILVALLALSASSSRSLGQCQEPSWGGIGAGANAGQGYTSTFAVAGMGSRIQSLSVPTTGGASLYASYDIGKEIRKIRAIGGATVWASDGTTLWAFNALNTVTNPLRFQSTFAPSGGIRDFIPVGLTVYSWTGNTVSVIDYTNPAAPSLISTIALPNTPFEASFLGNRLYFLSSGRTVQIIDVTDPANPAFIRALSLGGTILNTLTAPMAMSGGGSLVHFAFYSNGITVGSSVIRIVDINADQLAGTSGSVAISDSVVQFGFNTLITPTRLASVNWANPLAPVVTTIYTDTTSRFKSFGTATSSGVTRAYIAGGEGGFSVVNMNTATLQGRYQLNPGAVSETAFLGNTGALYTASGINGLFTEIVSDGGIFNRSIMPAGTFSNGTALLHVACGSNFAAVSSGTNVVACSTADPFNPFTTGTYAVSGTVEDIAGSGSSCFVVRNVSGVRQLDMVNMTTNPPSFQNSAPLPNDFTPFRRVRAVGSVVAVVVSPTECDLFTFGSPSPTSLTARGVISLPGANLQDAAITGSFLYLLDGAGLIRMYDITNPSLPAPLGTAPCTANDTAMALSGDWIAIVGAALDYINISDRTNPVTLTSGLLPNTASGVSASGPLGTSSPQFAVAAGSCGVRLYGIPVGWSPAINDQPDNTSACPGGAASFTVGAILPNAALFPTTFQWNRVGTGGGPISGATTPTLMIPTVSAADAAFTYTCTLTNSCGSVTTNPATLTLCRVDINCSGTVSVQDIFDFLALYFAGDTAADFNGVAGLTVQDLFDFLAAYFTGCA